MGTFANILAAGEAAWLTVGTGESAPAIPVVWTKPVPEGSAWPYVVMEIMGTRAGNFAGGKWACMMKLTFVGGGQDSRATVDGWMERALTMFDAKALTSGQTTLTAPWVGTTRRLVQNALGFWVGELGFQFRTI